MSARTVRKLQEAIIFETETCRVCALHLPEKRLKVHVRQHYVHNYCRCGERKHSRDSMRDHIRKYAGRPEHSTDVIECDEENFPALKKLMKWDNTVTFPECRPTLLGPGWPAQADARSTVEAKKKEKRERVADRLGSQVARVTTSPPATSLPPSEAPVIRVRRLALPEEETPMSNSKVSTAPLEVPTSQVPTTLENQWMWACLSTAATIDAEADQLEDKVAALRRKAASFRELAKKWRRTPEEE